MTMDGRTINLRSEDEDIEPEFRLENVSHDKAEPDFKSSDKVKVRFDKFVNLVATHTYEELFEKYHDEEIIMSTNLLADLANTQEDSEDGKKMPLIFVFGILLGVAITWILLKSNS